MSGICGLVQRDPTSRLSGGSLAPMLEALAAGERGGEVATAVGGGFALAARAFPGRLTGVVERTVRDRPVALAFHGSLFGEADSVRRAPEAARLHALLEAYLREGMDFVRRLRGDFAVAVWDGSTDALHLATDRFRVHPLFYGLDADKLVFASRLPAILASPASLKLSVDPESVVDVVGSSVVYSPRTIFREIKKLAPAHVLVYRDGEIRTSPYWELDFRESDRAGSRLRETLKTRFRDAIGVRAEGDETSGRLGAFLSGGVDSSTVTGELTQRLRRPARTFSVGFEVDGFNELEYARITARHFGSEHAEYFVTPADVADALSVVVRHFDEPFANASAVATYHCARLARAHGVDVLYAGDGGDELFAGNERYAKQRLFDYYGQIPLGLRRALLEPLVGALAPRLGVPLLVKAGKYIRRANIPYPDRLFSYGLFQELPITQMLDGALAAQLGQGYDAYGTMRTHYAQARARTELDRQLHIDLKMVISDNDVLKVTRMTEAAGVTVRYPFLDHPLAELAARIPASAKMRGRRLRAFFKDTYQDMLAAETIAKRKHGFGVPVALWLLNDPRLHELMRELVLSPRSVQRGYFQRSALEEIVRRHATESWSFYGVILWNLMVLEAWHREHRL